MSEIVKPDQLAQPTQPAQTAQTGKSDKPGKSKTLKDLLWLIFLTLGLIFYASIYLLPFVAVFGFLYWLTKGLFFLIFTIAGIIAYIGSIIYIIIGSIKEFSKPYDPTDQPAVYTGSGDSDEADKAAAAAGLIFGAGLLGHHIGKHHRSASDRVKDDWLWQEKYRDNDHYDSDGFGF